MTNVLRPTQILEKYQDLDLGDLRNRGIKCIFMDIDNTLAPYYEKEADENARAFIQKIKEAGIDVVLVSNNNEKRVSTYANSLGLPYHYYSLKPLPFTYQKLMKKYGLKKNEAVALGDQILTDVIGANLAGVEVYYTKPLVEKDSITTKLNRKIEKWIMRNILK